jgi:hypothetical protein
MTDIYEDIRIVVQRHREQAAEEEREKVIAFLVDNELIGTARCIQHKEHLK